MSDEELHETLLAWKITGSRKRALTQPPCGSLMKERLSEHSYESRHYDSTPHGSLNFSKARVSVCEDEDDPMESVDVYRKKLQEKELNFKMRSKSERSLTVSPKSSLRYSSQERKQLGSRIHNMMLKPSENPSISTHLSFESPLQMKIDNNIKPIHVKVKGLSFFPNNHLAHIKNLPEATNNISRTNHLQTQTSLLPHKKKNTFHSQPIYHNADGETESVSYSLWKKVRLQLELFAALPHIFYSYIYLALHLVIVLSVIYWIIRFVIALQHDLSSRIMFQQNEALAKAQVCEQNYIYNRCAPDTRVPALNALCSEWETCKNLNSISISKEAATTAEVLGSVIHTFFEQFSYKSFFLLGGWSLILVLVSYYVLIGLNASRSRTNVPVCDTSLSACHNQNRLKLS